MNSDATPARSIKPIYLSARGLTDPATREAYLDEACGNDRRLRRKVESLLAADTDREDTDSSPLDEWVSKFQPPRTGDLNRIEGESIDVAAHPLIGRYKLLEQIGEGGMGSVFMAQQTEPIQRQVALKLINPGMDSRQVVARFEVERQVLALMDHPHIANVLDAGTTDGGRPYIVMELVRGVPITDFCDEYRLTTNERLQLAILVCQAVHHAHQKGIVHRDIKPTNILVTMRDDHPVPKVIDFGVAKALHQSLTDQTLVTNFRQLIGTPLYMSPEQTQMNELDVDTRSDVYSLGVLLYELLTGTTPFDKETLKKAGYDETRRIIREDDPPRPSERLGTLSADDLSTVLEKRGRDERKLSQSLRGELDWIVMRALEKDRDRRYDSASALAADIDRYLQDEPIEACPPSWNYRLRKIVRRNRAVLFPTLLVLVSLLAATAVSFWAYRAEAQARKQVVQEAAGKQQALEQARDHLSRALQIVDEMYAQVATRWLSDDVAVTTTQANFLLKALAFYDDVMAQPETYNASDSQLAQLAFRSGLILNELRKYDEALDRFQQGIQILEVRETASPLEPPDRFQHAMLLNAAGILQDELGDQTAASTLVRRALHELDSLANQFPDNDDYREYRAIYTTNLANTEIDCGNAKAAEDNMRTAIASYNDVSQSDANAIGFRFTLAKALLAQGRLEEAEKILRKCQTSCQIKLYDEGDASTYRQLDQSILQDLFHLQLLQGHYEQADPLGDQWMGRILRSMPLEMDPGVYLLRGFIDPVAFPIRDQPKELSQFVRALMMQATTRSHTARPVEAELMLGRAQVMADYLQMAYAEVERHAVDLANVHAELATFLQPDFPLEAERPHAMGGSRVAGSVR